MDKDNANFENDFVLEGLLTDIQMATHPQNKSLLLDKLIHKLHNQCKDLDQLHIGYLS